MTAIWPAGPPKLSAATRAQVRTASANGTPCGRGAAGSVAPSPDGARPDHGRLLAK